MKRQMTAENVLEMIWHPGVAREERTEEERKAREWEESLHHADLSSGSETLDD